MTNVVKHVIRTVVCSIHDDVVTIATWNGIVGAIDIKSRVWSDHECFPSHNIWWTEKPDLIRLRLFRDLANVIILSPLTVVELKFTLLTGLCVICWVCIDTFLVAIYCVTETVWVNRERRDVECFDN